MSDNFSIEDIRKMQKKELEALLFFKNFCDEHGLLFYFCGGCCIGSLRNKGFIPWDDDIDIFMPRNDYEKLYELWDNSGRFVCLKTTKDKFIGNIFTTIVDTHTTCIKPTQKDLDIPHGLAMDVFPLDGCPSGKLQRKMQKLWALVYSLYLAQIIPTNHGKAVTLAGKVLLGIVPSKTLRYKIWKLAEKKMSKYKVEDCEYITELCAGPKYMQNEYPKAAFASAVLKEFEGYQMPIPVGYDDYLKIAFGDYMTPPPKDKQQNHHEFVFIDLENSYEKYRGTLFCVEELK